MEVDVNIFLVEDEENLLATLKLNLELEGYKVRAYANGAKAMKEFKHGTYNLAILDVMLPEVSGYELCNTIKQLDSEISVLFLTAKGGADDRVHGLRLGADDYLPKPFVLEELLLRVKNLVKRSPRQPKESSIKLYTFSGGTIDFQTYEISGVGTERKSLSKREMELLRLLIEKEGQVVSREEILDRVWGADVYPTSRTIDNYIVAFRKYFDSPNSTHFHSVRGVGYKFTA